MTRMDDVINTAGHRLSTGRLEEVINEHDRIVESAVLGFNHPLRGESPLAFVIMKGPQTSDDLTPEEQDKLAKEINEKVRADVGAFAKLEGVIFLNKLPKTRSGKILRGTMRKIANNQPYNFPATIDDATSLEVVTNRCNAWKIKAGFAEPEPTN